jgi:hypothetical protein
MSNSWKKAGITVLAAGLTVLGLSGLALVQPVAAAQNQAAVAVVAAHGGGGGGLRSEAAQAAAAEALGMTVEDLQTQLWAGASLADLAEAAGVDLQVVQAAVTAAHVQAARDAIAEAVADGSITQANADWLIEGLDAGYWTGGGFGLGRGGPHLFDSRPPSTPDVAPTTEAPADNS